jgi:hypothetical protein
MVWLALLYAIGYMVTVFAFLWGIEYTDGLVDFSDVIMAVAAAIVWPFFALVALFYGAWLLWERVR